MGKTLTTLALVTLFLFSTVSTSLAWSRHYGASYRSHYHSRPAVHYRSHYPAVHYRSHYKRHYHHSDDYWAYLGVGLLTGAVVSSLAYRPARERTVVYTTPPPVIIHRPPVNIRRQYYRPYYRPTIQPELILRRVETTPQLLNVRRGPGVGEMVTSQVQRGTVLDVVGVAPDWLYVRTQFGVYGWVMAQYTSDVEGPAG